MVKKTRIKKYLYIKPIEGFKKFSDRTTIYICQTGYLLNVSTNLPIPNVYIRGCSDLDFVIWLSKMSHMSLSSSTAPSVIRIMIGKVLWVLENISIAYGAEKNSVRAEENIENTSM